MPQRKYPANAYSFYRYSINGQEKENQLNENITTAEYWEYNTRTCRRWNIDPVMKLWESPYLAFNGNPILLSDRLGNNAAKPNDWVKDKDGKWIWKEEIKTGEQARAAGFKDYRAPNSVIDNPDYDKVDNKSGIVDGNKIIKLADNGKIFVGIIGLEVHSNKEPTLSDGHAWISLYDVEFKDQQLSFGLWPDNNKKVKNNGPGFDLRTDVEKDRLYKPTSSIYVGITKEQQDLFYLKTKQDVTWKNEYTCANWARDCFYVITKIWLKAEENVMGTTTGTPRILDKSISNYKGRGVNLYPENRGKSDGAGGSLY